MKSLIIVSVPFERENHCTGGTLRRAAISQLQSAPHTGRGMQGERGEDTHTHNGGGDIQRGERGHTVTKEGGQNIGSKGCIVLKKFVEMQVEGEKGIWSTIDLLTILWAAEGREGQWRPPLTGCRHSLCGKRPRGDVGARGPRGGPGAVGSPLHGSGGGGWGGACGALPDMARRKHEGRLRHTGESPSLKLS